MIDMDRQTAAAEEATRLLKLATDKHREAMDMVERGEGEAALALIDEAALVAADGQEIAIEAGLPLPIADLDKALGQLSEQRNLLIDGLNKTGAPHQAPAQPSAWMTPWLWLTLLTATIVMVLALA